MTTPQTLAVAAPLLAFALAGCSPSESPKTPVASAKAPPTAKKAGKSGDGLPAPDCPAKVDTALAGPDIVGLKLGMAREAALNFTRCLHKDSFVTFDNAWLQNLRTFGVKLAPQAFSARLGETSACKFRNFDDMQKCGAGNRVWTHEAEKITVASPGVPGREQVVAIWREQHFKPGEMPEASGLLPALVQKYGPPQGSQQQANMWMRFDWLQDASGTPLQPGSRLYGQCRGVNNRAQDSHQWSEACGLTITAMIVLNRENPLLAQELNIGMMHQAALYTLGKSLQIELQAMENERRQQEAAQNRSAAANVKL